MNGSHSVAKQTCDPRIEHASFSLPRVSSWKSKGSSKFPFICGHVEQLRVLRVAVFDVLRETGSTRRYTVRSSWSARARYCAKNSNNKLVR